MKNNFEMIFRGANVQGSMCVKYYCFILTLNDCISQKNLFYVGSHEGGDHRHRPTQMKYMNGMVSSTLHIGNGQTSNTNTRCLT